MATPKVASIHDSNSVGNVGEEIVIEIRQEIGRVRITDDVYARPAIVEAFALAGEFINAKVAHDTDQEGVRLQFEFAGRTFIAAVEE